MFRASLRPKHVEELLITNKSLIVASSWSQLYLLFKDARSFEYKNHKMDQSQIENEKEFLFEQNQTKIVMKVVVTERISFKGLFKFVQSEF